MNTLVVCYSNSGTTRMIAERIAAYLGADLDDIVETKERPRLVIDGQKAEAGGGALTRAALGAVLGLGSSIVETPRNPAGYDLVIVGTPVWCGSLTPPVRSYLKRHSKSLKRVAFFCTCGEPAKTRVFSQMRKASGKEPLATIAVKADDAHTDACSKGIAEFAESLRSNS